MSTVVLDTITGKSTATTITIGSTPVVSASANSMTIRGEGSNQTSIQQGLAKMWLHYNHDTPAVQDSFNVTSVTDVTTGNFDPQYTNSMNSSNYAVFRMGQAEATNADCTQYCYNKATGSVRCVNVENNAGRDLANTDAGVFGDLA